MGQINLRTILICALGAFGGGIVFCRAMGYGAEGAFLFSLCGLGTGWTAGWSLTKKWPMAVPGGILALFSVIVCGFYHQDAVMGAFAAVAGALSVLGVRLCGFGFHGGVGAWSLTLSVLGMLFAMGCSLIWQVAAAITSILNLLLYLEALRYGSLRKGHFLKDNVPSIGRSQAQSIGNFAVFLACAVPVGLLFWGLWWMIGEVVLEGLKDAARGTGGLIAAIAQAIEDFYIWLLHFFRMDPPTDKNPSGGDGGRKGFSMGVAGLISTMGTVAMVVAACFLVAGIGFYVARKGFKLARQQRQEEDYEDFDEELERPKGNLLRRFLNRFQKQKISDFSDPSMKVRFAFQQLLRKKQKEQGSVFHKTPNELLDPAIPGEAALVSAYNRVKYAKIAATQEDAVAAEQYVKAL